MTYRQLQQVLKQFRNEGKIPATFKLNQRKNILKYQLDRALVSKELDKSDRWKRIEVKALQRVGDIRKPSKKALSIYHFCSEKARLCAVRARTIAGYSTYLTVLEDRKLAA